MRKATSSSPENHSGLDLNRDGVVEIVSAATSHGGARNPLLIKLGPTPSGNAMTVVWARSPRSPGGAAQTRAAADGRAGAYVSSAFRDSLEFDGGPTLTGAGGLDGFVARYDGAGSLLWARVFGGPGNVDAVIGLAADRDANH